MEKRCYVKEDCEDGSDEQDCGKLIIKPGYKKSLIPVPRSGQDLVVNVSLKITDILGIDELSGSFRVKFWLQREWFDRRLTYKNLNQKDNIKNNLLADESAAVWYPRFVFYNVENVQKTIPATKFNEVHRVMINKDFGFTAQNNMHLYQGSQNALSLEKQFYVEWICIFDMQWYPFDTHICSMKFLLRGTEFIKLVPTLLKHNPDISLDRYTIRKVKMCTSMIDGRQSMGTEVTLSRPIINNILTVFIPTTTLLAISFIARFFAKDYIDMVVQVNLTILLVLATL